MYKRGNVANGVLAGDLVLVAPGDYSFGLRERPDGTLGFNSALEIDHNYADRASRGRPCSRTAIRSRRCAADNMVCLVAVAKGSRDCIDDLKTELATFTRLGLSPVTTILFDGAGSSEYDRSTPVHAGPRCSPLATRVPLEKPPDGGGRREGLLGP